MSAFTLHERLQADTFLVGDLPLCRVLLLNDARYPWLVLVPRRANLGEIHQLDADDRAQLMAESCQVAETMERLFEFDKMNLGALGNLVPQLHIHHVARSVGDPAWPGPVWGHSPARPYEEQQQLQLQQRLREQLDI